ncbi:MAG: hypothetical protein PHS14_00375 [Elusimicrobia bacterium]|nr:hypothetical protein [Elusimicrobiota bacterium]
MTPAGYLAAAKVPITVPAGQHGPWTLRRQVVPPSYYPRVGGPVLTFLARMTPATLHTEFGDVVMEDSAEELRRHLPIWMAARGRVLVSGLGLGCVVRGLLANQRVDRIDVVEIDRHILDVVGPEFRHQRRVRLHHGDALTYPWDWRAGDSWDYAWHDIWTEEGNGVPLHRLHMELLARYNDHVGRQGAWALPREVKRYIHGILG